MLPVPQSTKGSSRANIKQGFQIGLFVTVLLLLVWSANLFANIRLNLSNIYFVSAETSEHIVIVALDDASLGVYGRSPSQWPRSLYGDLLELLGDAEARVVAFDLLFAESSEDDEILAETIRQIRASDTRTRVVMPVAGAGDLQMIAGEGDTAPLAFANVLLPVEPLAELVDYLAYVNTFADVDGTIRRQPSFIQSGDLTRLSFSLATYLAYLRIPSAAVPQVLTSDGDVLQVTPERTLHLDYNGLWVQNYFGSPGTTFPIVSMQAVLDGEIDLALFNDKIVLVGLISNQGATDRYIAPSSDSGQQMAGVEIQAHAIETLIRDAQLREQSALSQIVIIVVLAFGSAMVYVHLRWYWKLAASLCLLMLFFAAASISFSIRHEIVNLFHPGLALVLPVIISNGLDITVEIRRRQNTEFLLESVVSVSNQQMATDMILKRIAADVQRIATVEMGVAWLSEGDRETIYEFPDGSQSAQTLRSIYNRAQAAKTSIIEDTQLAIPILWQQRLIGVIAVQLTGRQRAGGKSILLLEDLAQRIAPGLENAVLYSEVRRQRELLEVILYTSPTCNAILDNDYTVSRANEAFHTQFVAKAASFDSMQLFDLLVEIGLDEESGEELKEQFAKQQAFQKQVILGNRTFDLHTTRLPVLELWIVVLNDITALSELSRLKTRMIRMASHGLRNPLATLLGYGSLLQHDKNELSEKQLKYIGNMIRAGKTMRTIVEDVLSLEQLRSVEVPFEPTPIEQLVHEVIDRHRPDIAMKRQNFSAEIAGDLPLIHGQPTQLSQSVTNLLGNAVKYTPEGGNITLRLYQNSPESIRLEIEDTGYGISSVAQKKLFTEFYRVKTKETAEIPGTGLGLSLVKSVVEAHGGSTWVESEENVGSTFFVELPVVKDGENNDK